MKSVNKGIITVLKLYKTLYGFYHIRKDFYTLMYFEGAMRGRFCIFLVAMLVLAPAVFGATLHGAVYDSSLNIVEDVQLEINTTPKQNHISKNGLYFFNVPLGTFEITVEKFYQKQLIYSTKKVVEVTNDGQFRIEIILERVPGTENITGHVTGGPSLFTMLRARFGYLFYGSVVLILIAIIVMLFFYIRSLRKDIGTSLRKETAPVKEKIAMPAEEKPVKANVEHSTDLDTILKVIKQEGGRTTQKQIRKKVPLSEAKISLMISELEAKGKLQKIKKGRGNIIVLK
jgi:uncharacterized membrane protein